MINFLTNYYNKIYIVEDFDKNVYSYNYIKYLYYLKDNINFIKNPLDLLNLNTNVDTFYRSKNGLENILKKIPVKEDREKILNIIQKNFIDNNFLQHLPLDDKFVFNEDKEKLIDNASRFYKLVNLNQDIKFDFFHFNRNFEKEKEVCEEILFNHNLNKSDKFNIICEPKTYYKKVKDMDKNHINNNFTNINIHNICEFPGLLIPLFNMCEEMHLIGNSNSLLIYYLQYTKMIDINKNVYFYHYCRERGMLDLGMVTNPKLDNWTIIF